MAINMRLSYQSTCELLELVYNAMAGDRNLPRQLKSDVFVHGIYKAI